MSADSSLTGVDPGISTEASDDATLIEFLRAEGAEQLRHGGGRSLLEHLVETYEVIARWGQPAPLRRAALLHSIYGTDVYQRRLVALSRRDELSRLAGAQAERLAYLFSVTPRAPLLSGAYTWLHPLPAGSPGAGAAEGDEAPPSRAELDALLLLHMANLAEQARSRDRSPATWLVRLRDVAEPLIGGDTIVLPAFLTRLSSLTEADEELTRRGYLLGLRADEGMEGRERALALASSVCPVIPEPCVWLAHLARCRGDLPAARAWAGVAHERLHELGTTWDKRLGFAEWRALAEYLGELSAGELRGRDRPTTSDAITDPRRLLEETLRPPRVPASARRAAPAGVARAQPAVARATGRFDRYVESLGNGDRAALGRHYPDLESQPWYDAHEFPLAVYLEENFAAIREEVLALDPSRFHRESEPIKRSGDWDVAFLYERGRRRDDLCEACPVIARGIEGYSAMRTVTGLSYLSRMRGGAHIAAHRGPTNLRLRCHLGIEVPTGDCAIRVGEETRPWREGRCLVFDDFFPHEAWNHTDRDRIVLIVDLWHPDLSATEVRLLEGLQRYAYAHALNLAGYWSANAAAARAPAED